MTVKNLIKHLQSLGKERQDYSVRVIEEKDYYESGDAKPNFWLYSETDIELNNTGQSGYEMSGEVRLIGSE